MRMFVVCLPVNSLTKCVWTVFSGAAVQQVEPNLVRELRQSSYNTDRWHTTPCHVFTQRILTFHFSLKVLSWFVKRTCRQGKLPNNGFSSSISRRSGVKKYDIMSTWSLTWSHRCVFTYTLGGVIIDLHYLIYPIDPHGETVVGQLHINVLLQGLRVLSKESYSCIAYILDGVCIFMQLKSEGTDCNYLVFCIHWSWNMSHR